MPRPIAFFDLDGTLRDTYLAMYPRANQVTVFPGVTERLTAIRGAGYWLVGITNQGGVSTGAITSQEVEQANLRTQELLGQAKLDLLLFCPHHDLGNGHICDCKKPAPGMLLDALSELPGSTLKGSTVVGDSLLKDKGVADALAIPFIAAEAFRSQTPKAILDSMTCTNVSQKLSLDRVMGTLVGMAVGDALAACVEFWPRKLVQSTYPDGLKFMRASSLWQAGEYTDDTQMALLIADSLLQCGELNPKDVAIRFRHWSKTAKDVGIQTRRVVNFDGYVEHPEDVSRQDYEQHPKNAAGNGAVMRCAPVALFHSDSLPMLLADSRRSARITHGDPKAQASCVLLNCAINRFIHGGGRDSPWQQGMKFLTPYELKAWSRLPAIASLKITEIASSGYTVSTVEAAFWSFEQTDSFEAAIELAASLGDDADTVAAVTGALAGAYYGYSAIPDQWRKDLRDEELIRETALRLAKIS